MSLTGISQTSSSLPTTSTGRSLLSRLTSPLRSRSRNLTDFHIRPDEPHRQYSPGDVVKGLVVLTVVKPIRITHLTVALHGFVRVFKTANGVGDGLGPDPALTLGNDGARSQYFGNGQASLFHDEVTLCGEGRLEIGVYEFEFELEFPKRGLPTSIDFERGSISYIIRATITRPTSIAPTSNCERKVSLIETVDIGPMVPPTPLTIFLEPISRRPKKSTKSTSSKAKSKSDKEATERGSIRDAARHSNSPNPEESASQRPSSDGRVPRSPSDVHSETSGESVVSSSSTGLSFRLGHIPPSAKSGSKSQGCASHNSLNSKTITATIELMKAGCLPGDNLPLRVSIQHTKFIKSLRGIIITLYRQGRIDSAPPLSLFTNVKGKAAERLKHEEYYPKSKTGLGGLSLTSAGSSSVFRKDLSQTFAPLIVDPSTLSTIVTTSLRVPEDVFPTITGVPGQMISFRYHIEVVIDLGGKLASHDRSAPRMGIVNVPSNFLNHNNQTNNPEGGTNTGVLATWGNGIVETDHIRREKSVVACSFEIIVGTTDSARLRGRGNTLPGPQAKGETTGLPQSPTFTNEVGEQHESHPDDAQGELPFDSDFPYHGEPHYATETLLPEDEEHHFQFNDSPYNPTHQSRPYAPTFVPLPEMPSEESLTEKDQIRRAEVRLLPSQPPQDDGPSSSRTILPSAPEDPEEYLYGTYDESRHIPLTPSAPELGDLPPQTISNPTEDKQELERRRLMAEASSPPEPPEDYENPAEGSSGAQNEPTAPILREEDEHGGHYSAASGQHEGLPRYER